MMTPRTQATAFDVEMAMAHIPVLTHELLDLLDLHPDSIVVDSTFGAGGHAGEVGSRLGPNGELIACDRDPLAQVYFEDLKATKLRCLARFYLGNFADTLHQLNQTGLRATQVYMDLGVSSMQLDTQERGFSYSYDAPLDMRMDPESGRTAEEIVNTWDERRLARIFYEYGEERYARRIARAIVRNRARAPYTRTAELVETVKEAIPTPARFGSRNPARRVFQALRIAVNDELDSLRRALPEALELLEPGGVLAVISFHSLEDRIVKEFFAAQARPCTCPPDFPVCVCGKEATMEILTSKALVPGAQEVAANPRSSSAKLRAARKL
jgi:16S rRNA (cytosine1402-N4)-methyltransferase